MYRDLYGTETYWFVGAEADQTSGYSMYVEDSADSADLISAEWKVWNTTGKAWLLSPSTKTACSANTCIVGPTPAASVELSGLQDFVGTESASSETVGRWESLDGTFYLDPTKTNDNAPVYTQSSDVLGGGAMYLYRSLSTSTTTHKNAAWWIISTKVGSTSGYDFYTEDPAATPLLITTPWTVYDVTSKKWVPWSAMKITCSSLSKNIQVSGLNATASDDDQDHYSAADDDFTVLGEFGTQAGECCFASFPHALTIFFMLLPLPLWQTVRKVSCSVSC